MNKVIFDNMDCDTLFEADIDKRQATVFDIQRFSIHDGPGIRTTIFF